MHGRQSDVGAIPGQGFGHLGLQEGDQVITSGGLGLEDKAKVEVQAPKGDDDDDDDDDKDK